MRKVKYTRKIYLDGKLCSKPPSPDKKGQTTIHGETEAAVITPYVALIVREIVKEQPEELEKPITTKEGPPVLPKTPVTQQVDIAHGIKEDKFDQIQLQRRKWSGFTFINEGIRRFNEIIYERELVKALNARQKWTSIQKKLVKDSNRELHTGSGPLWFQEPSDKQIVLVTQLGDILKADDEEGIISRTKQFLSELGVVPNISGKDIFKGMKESYLDPVNFLLEMHAAVAVRQNKNPSDEKSFSTNERILLTAVCSLHLPFLLLMIHIMLPLSKAKRDINITSDCLDKKVQYCCPYLEPILCRGPTWFDQQIKQQLKRLLLIHKGIPMNCDEGLETGSVIEATADKRFSVIITEPMISYYLNICAEECLKIGSFETLIDGMRKSRKSEKSYTSRSNSMYYVKRLPRRTTIEIGDESSVITIPDFDKKGATVPLAQQPVGTEKENINSQGINKDILQSKVDIEPEVNKETDKQEKGQVNPPPMPLVLNFSKMDYAKVAINSNFKENSCPCTDEQKYELFIQKNPCSVVRCEYVINEVDHDSSKPEQMSVENTEDVIRNSNVKKLTIEENQDMIEGSKTEQMNVGTKQEANNKVSLSQSETDLPNIVQASSIQEENTFIEVNNVSLDEEEKSTQDSIPDPDIQKLLNSVEMVPQRKQLEYVLKILAGAGDPLAQLPDCHRLASVQRWFELRRGIRAKLTEKDNNQLLEASRRMWTVSPHSGPIQVPKIKMKKTEERALTWAKRNWVRKKVDEEYTRYFSKVKQQKINNARSFFPTMMTQFYNKSKLNHDFRKCFYTYLPAREADIYVYRPWKLDENKHLSDK